MSVLKFQELFKHNPYVGSLLRGDSNVQLWHKFGRNTGVGTSAETVWGAGGLYPWSSLATAQALEIVSSSANDASAGTGARTVLVEGLDTNYAVQSETVTLNGVTAVDLANSYLRIHRIAVKTAGSGATNAGNLTLRLDAAGATVGYVAAGYGQSEQCVFTIPANYRGLVFGGWAGINKQTAASVDFELFMRPEGEVFQLKDVLALKNDGATTTQITYPVPLIVAEKTGIDVRALASTTSVDANAALDILLVQI